MPAKSNAEWELWGQVDPLRGVAGRKGRERGGTNPWTDEDFYALGRSDWADFLLRWDRYAPDALRDTCVDVGCGAGRISYAMTSHFDRVIGVDVSKGMLEKARQWNPGQVEFVLSDGLSLPVGTEAADAVFSAHTFQHIDSLDEVKVNLAEVARVLRPGGTMLLHAPVHIWPSRASSLESAFQVRQQLARTRARIRRARMIRGKRGPIMRGQNFEWRWIETALRTVGLVDVELAVFRMASNSGTHPTMFARKPTT